MHAYTDTLQRRSAEARAFGAPRDPDEIGPPPAPLAMPEQPLDRPTQPARFAAVPGLWARRAALAAFCAASTGLAVFAVTSAMARDGLEPLELAHVALILVLFGWMAFSFAACLGGLWLSRRSDVWERTMAGAPLPPLTRRTALLAPIHHEDVGPFFERLARMRDQLHALGLTRFFDIMVLSDSRRPEVVAEERRGFAAFRRAGIGPRAYYRHRPNNIDRKAGNIADWVGAHGGAYDHMVVLDADSLMDAQTLWRLAAAMEADPSLGLIQTAPTIIERRTVFGRLEQFANTLYGPLAAWSVAWWSGTEGNYWGHNAILRVEAFAQSGGLPHLKGRKPFGGHIMSHDFVEAAFLRRAGWGVRLAPALGGSFEESPPTLIDHLIRDRRWCQGNLQHLGVVGAKGLHPVSRLHLARGVLSYALAPLWIALVVTGALLSGPEAGTGDGGGYPLAGAIVLAVSLAFVLASKLLSYAMAVAEDGAQRFGGAWRALASVGLETAASTLTAPIIMAAHTRALLSVTLGRDAGWSAQQRGEGRLRGRAALAFHWPEMLIGLALALIGPLTGAGLSPWLAVAATSLVAAPFIVWWTASIARGLRLREAGLLLTPGERAAPQEAGVNSFSPKMPETIRARQTSRPAVAGSLNSRMPTTAVPTAPTPVHTA
ncbi:MAG: glucans biosynthesis glucosyltransferase MdoH [Caulobacter sp.]|nr:glucans biosynthesis glucosyltransferase MdoH [Caulobacter sp.]